MGSGVNPKTFSSGLSFSVSLIREPLNPTKATPAITVIKEIHLDWVRHSDRGSRRRQED
jgi:hypothetical protein